MRFRLCVDAEALSIHVFVKKLEGLSPQVVLMQSSLVASSFCCWFFLAWLLHFGQLLPNWLTHIFPCAYLLILLLQSAESVKFSRATFFCCFYVLFFVGAGSTNPKTTFQDYRPLQTWFSTLFVNSGSKEAVCASLGSSSSPNEPTRSTCCSQDELIVLMKSYEEYKYILQWKVK